MRTCHSAGVKFGKGKEGVDKLEKEGKISEGRKKGRILLAAAAVFAVCFLLFAADMAGRKVRDKKGQKTMPAAEEAEGRPEELRKVDLTAGESPVPEMLVMAELAGITGSKNILVKLDGDETAVELAGVCPADCVDGMPVKFKTSAAAQMEKLLGHTDVVYLDIQEKRSDGSYLAYVFDSGDVDTTDIGDFRNHCVNAAMVREGFCGISSDGGSVYSGWMQEELEKARKLCRGIWTEPECYELYGYTVPENLQGKISD